MATVTVVEEFDPDFFLHGPRIKTAPTHFPSVGDLQHTKLQSKRGEKIPEKKSKGKRIRYETKDARKVERTKQRARRTEKAELAGGKASKRKGSGKSKKKGGSR